MSVSVVEIAASRLTCVGRAKDLDAFYASVVENENPALKNLPLAIQVRPPSIFCPLSMLS